jgi:hypothetical protein
VSLAQTNPELTFCLLGSSKKFYLSAAKKKAGMCDPSLARKAKVLYFFAAGAAMGAAMGAAAIDAGIGALPCKKALTQVVLETIAK